MGSDDKRPPTLDQEWARLAKEVNEQLERDKEDADEDVDDDDTELYVEVALDLVTEEVPAEPPTPDLLPPLTREPPELDLPDPEPTSHHLLLPEPEASEELPEIDWKGLRPASVVVNLIPRTWKTILGFWPLLLVILVGGNLGGGEAAEGVPRFGLSDVIFVGLFLSSGAINTVIHFLTLRYRVHRGKLEIKQGLLNRQARTIDPARIQNVGLVRNFFHNLTGLVEVRIETAGDARTEGLLSALSEADATELMDTLAALRGRTPAVEGQDAPGPEPLLKLGIGELLAFGLSRARAGLVVVLLVVGMEVFPLLSPDQANATLDSLGPGAIAGGLLLALVGSWVGSALLTVIRHYGFSLHREADPDPKRVTLASREGLFTTRNMRIPLGKVQLVLADEPVIRRAMGFATMSVETAGLGSVKEGVSAAELVIPMADREELPGLMTAALPVLTIDPWTTKLRPAHPRALYRMTLSTLARTSAIAVPVALFFEPWGLLALGLFPLNLLTTWLDWRAQGWLVTDDVVVSRRGFWRRRTWVLSRSKIQSVHVSQGPLMRLHGLGRLAVRVAGSQIVLPDLGMDPARTLLEELSPVPELDLE
jgi:putative membrane protein